MWNTSQRFENQKSAEYVLSFLRKVTKNASFEVRYCPLDEVERKKGFGEWAICFETDSNPTFDQTQKIFDAIEFATKIALADALNKTCPGHLLLKTWHLNPKNLDNLAKIDCSLNPLVR